MRDPGPQVALVSRLAVTVLLGDGNRAQTARVYRTLMMLAAADALAFGIGSLLLPDVVLSILGGTTDDLGRALLRELGAILVSLGLITWFLRDLDEGPLRRGVTGGALVGIALTAVIVGLVTASGMFNVLGWVIVAIHVVLAAGLAWVLVRSPAIRHG